MKTLTFNDPFTLQCSAKLEQITMAYETFGELNNDKSNAILICHALTGDSHVTSNDEHEQKGWWEDFVGKKKAIDTEKYFVICINVLGSCLGSTNPTSINPETKKPYNLDFPVITIADMVACQKKVLDHLEIEQLFAIIGPSMGGMQAFQWLIDYPDFMKRCVVVAASTSLSPQALAFGTVARQAIVSDELFNDGLYADKAPKKGLSIARMIGHITYLSKNL